MKTVFRHSLTVRVTHWFIALSGILLLFSGFGQMPMYKRYNVVKIPGFGWSDNYEITLLLHYIGAIFFTAAIVFHLLYHFRRREFGILPRKGDIKGSLQGLMAMVGMAREPRHGKFQAKQRVIYVAFGGVGVVLVLTGLVKSYKNLGPIIVDPLFLQWVAFIHSGAGMVFMAMLIAHVAALLIYRPLLPSMFSGRIDREYAQKHHPDWNPEN